MNSRYFSCLRAGFLIFACVLATPQFLLAQEREDEGKSAGDESWQIEQRQRWFEETRGLRGVANASALRSAAVAALKEERARQDSTQTLLGESWQEIGPSSMNMLSWIMGRVSGRLNAITPLPSDENTVYVGAAAGGVWKTTNGGQGWTSIFDQVGTLPIGAITLDPATPSTLWVGTGDKNGGGCAGYFGQGVFLSEDAGVSWSARNGSGPTSMPLSVVNAVAVQPTDSNVILVGGAGACDANGNLSGAGIYRSIDRGLSWSKVRNNNTEDILFVPGTATVYAGQNGLGVFKSIDGGLNWTSVSNGLGISGSRLRLAMAPSDSNVMYVLNESKLYRSGDAGASWTLQSNAACEGQCTYNQTLSVHATNPDTVLVGSIRFSKSTNAGVTLTPLTSTWGSSQTVHQDTHVLRWSLSNPDRFWVGSDGGIWRSDDGGSTFNNMNANINITQFYDIAVDPGDANIVFGGAQDNSSSGRRTSTVWNLTFASGDGFMNAIDENDPTIVFQTSYPSGGLPYIVRSTTGGAPGSFTRMLNSGLGSGSFPWVTPLATAGSQLFVASDEVYRANTLGNSWTQVSGSLGSSASVITTDMRGVLTPTYVGTSAGKIFFSADAGIASPVFSDVTGNYSGGRVSDIAMDPVNTQRVFLTRAGFGAARLYRSASGGTSWTAVGNGLPNVPANAVAIDPLDANRIFVGTDIGVYQSTDGGDNFTAFSAGLPLGLVVTDLEIDDIPHVLTAGTYSRGAWRLLLNGSAGNSAPTADFEATSKGLVATFSDLSIDLDGSIVAHNWDFGDGSAASTEANPQHAYPAPGSYTVLLQVTDDAAASSSFAKVVRINRPPVALTNGVALTDQSGAQGEQLLYTLEVPAGATNLHFETSGNVANQDADLYVSLNGQPLCQSAGPADEEVCNIANPQPGTWLATVDAYTALTNFTILGSFDAPVDLIFANGFD